MATATARAMGTTASSADHNRAAGTSVLSPSWLRFTRAGASACTKP